MKNSPTVEFVSECFVKPQSLPEESKQPLHLSPWDLMSLSVHYIQTGLLFQKPSKPPNDFIQTLIEKLKNSLSIALSQFYPLTGRLKTIENQEPPSRVIYVDCRDGPGARFIVATLDSTVSDILSQTYVPTTVLQTFFDHHKAVNHDGHELSLLSVQVTELKDGVFIGTSMNHCLGDGTSYYKFISSWSEIFMAAENTRLPIISPSQILKRWFPDGYGPIFPLPFGRPEDFISRFEAPELKVRIFHFSAGSIANLKAKANLESSSNTISSFQSLSALVWKSVTRARSQNRDPNRTTTCMMIANIRPRMNPPISENYFGNSLHMLVTSASAGELTMSRGIGWAAQKLHRAVTEFDESAVRKYMDEWVVSPCIHQSSESERDSVLMGSSPRFDTYKSEFGMGKAVALLRGYANKFDGKVSASSGRNGGGSVDLEVCLSPETMSALESDVDFMEAAGF